MKFLKNSEEQINEIVATIHEQIQPGLYETHAEPKEAYQMSEQDLNRNILDVTMKIRDQYPELTKFIEEMPVTIPNDKNPEITNKDLSNYLDSLNSVIATYTAERPAIAL